MINISNLTRKLRRPDLVYNLFWILLRLLDIQSASSLERRLRDLVKKRKELVDDMLIIIHELDESIS